MQENSRFHVTYWMQIAAYARLGKVEAIQDLIDKVGYRKDFVPSEAPALLYFLAAQELYLVRNEVLAKEYASKAVQAYLKSNKTSDREWLAKSYYLNEDWEKAEQLFQSLSTENPDNLDHLSILGIIAAKKPETGAAQARSIIQRMEGIENKYDRGSKKYAQARIYAHLGNKEKAMELLEQAYQEGKVFFWVTYDWDIALVPLFDYPPFQEFVKPKG